MTTIKLPRLFRSLLLTSLFACFDSGPSLLAQSATGSIEGRVANPSSGDYLAGVRVTVEGTSLETFTDAVGQYRLPGVPAGQARITVFRTGAISQTQTLAIRAGETVQYDFQMEGFQSGPQPGGPIKLSQFVVNSSREMEASAIAINEQRFAPNIKSVLSTDEFGFVAEGNVGEFLKFLPGVTVEYVGGFASKVSINGVPPDNVPVTVDGFSIASSGDNANTGRAVAVDLISLNNLSRLEVSFSPTPESPGSALAGSVNMVPRSAFERARPVFNGTAYVMMRDNDRHWARTPGPRANPSRKVHPGFDFSAVVPVSKQFGFSLSGGQATQYSEESMSQNTWRGTGVATNGAAFPNTTPDKPYLTNYLVADRPKDSKRTSFGATLDFRLTAADRLSLAFVYGVFDDNNSNRSLTFNITRVLPGNFSPTMTQGDAAAGDLTAASGMRHRYNETVMPTLAWHHLGPIWKADAGFGVSRATNILRGSDKGFFRFANARRTGVTIRFDDMYYLRPNTITVRDGTTGAPINPYRLESYALNTITDDQPDIVDLQRSLFANIGRDFQIGVPFTLKAGVDLRQTGRDLRTRTRPLTFVGRDGRASTLPSASDDSAAPFLHESISQRVAPYGFPKIEWASNWEVFDFHQVNPDQFLLDQNAQYRAAVTGSKYANELISSAFARGDIAFLDRRLKLVGGIRAEQTNVKADGPLSDPTRNVRRDSAGRPVLDATGRPVPITLNALEASKLTFLERAAHVEKEYLRLFPSLNVSYNVRPNLVARAAHYYSVGRPNLNQYAGGITLPDTDLPPGPGNRIVVQNAAIKAWSARTTSVRLEYYFEGVGQVSVGAFRREIENFFDNSVFNATSEFLANYGLSDSTYGDYDVATQQNVSGVVRMEGLDFNYKQALTFLPRWARGVQVFANASTLRTTGARLANFTGLNAVPRSGSWGISLTRERFNVRMHWNYRSRQRLGEIAAGGSIESGTYNWRSKRLQIDLLGEYFVYKRIAVFANLRNIGDAPDDTEIVGPNTPDLAQFRGRTLYGSLWTFGVKSTF